MAEIGRPAGTLADVYAHEEMSIADRETSRRMARLEAINRAIKGAVGTQESNLTLHDIRPDADLNAGGVTYEQWLTAALVAGTNYTYVNDTQLDVKKSLVINGGFVDEPNPSPSEIQFRQNATGTVPLLFINVTKIRSYLVNRWFMSELVAYDPQDIINILIVPSVTDAAGQIVGFTGYVAEPKGRPFIGPSI